MNQINQSVARLGDFAMNSMAAPSQRRSKCSPDVAIDCATVLVGCFRKVDGDNPEILARAFVLVLSEYPEEVVRKVTHPSRGLPSKQQWVPTVYELRQACEAAMPPPPSRRSAPLPTRIIATDDERAATLDRIKARHPSLFSVDAREDAQKPIPEAEIAEKYRGQTVLIPRELMETRLMRGAS